MDMYKKREMRKNKIKNDNQDVFHKTSINWEITTYGKLLYKKK